MDDEVEKEEERDWVEVVECELGVAGSRLLFCVDSRFRLEVLV